MSCECYGAGTCRACAGERALHEAGRLHEAAEAMAEALRAKVRKPYYTGRADGLWTCGECERLLGPGCLEHKPGCAVAALAAWEQAQPGKQQ